MPSGPETFPKNFCAPGARYVIELAAGRASELQISAGQTLDL